ncbi:hypothetical protein DW972_03420 [Anaerobutyricum hallii]|uniref:Uncharacterized protein n=1 Tax=Anaerobutyricum hallii TaxID=39488 RepID=A0A413Q059_9FIRM|nr:hypothetical protein DW972_03420 [Anaerobutyricum hallii]
MKNHSYNLHAPICGIFCFHSVAVARYAALIQENLPHPKHSPLRMKESLFVASEQVLDTSE